MLIDMNPIGGEHEGVVEELIRHFVRPDAPWRVRAQTMLITEGGYVLPDLLVFERGGPLAQLPSTALLVVEVSQASHQRDREKVADYARAGVPEYWIVDIPGRVVCVHREPRGESYASIERFAHGTQVQPLLDVPPLAVTALFDK
jgi:Uma2 family endonuclease